MKPCLSSKLARDQRGTASLESALMLPVIALCWAGVFLYFNAYASVLGAGSTARNAGLSTSAGSCQQGERTSCPEPPKTGGDGWADLPQQHALLDRVLGPVFGPTTEKKAERDYEIPALLGGGVRVAPYDYQITCNEPPPRLNEDQILREVACEYLAQLGYGPCGAPLPASGCEGNR